MVTLSIADLRTITIIIDDYKHVTKDKYTKEIVSKYSEKLHKILKENSK